MFYYFYYYKEVREYVNNFSQHNFLELYCYISYSKIIFQKKKKMIISWIFLILLLTRLVIHIYTYVYLSERESFNAYLIKNN
jgi:hypothetical protein